jgi:hypothetical protein
VDNTQRRQIVQGDAELSADGTYATGGLAVTWEFTDWQGDAFIPEGSGIAPVWAEFQSQAGLVGQTYLYDPATGKLRIAVAGVELGNGDAITADTIGFRAEFARGY